MAFDDLGPDAGLAEQHLLDEEQVRVAPIELPDAVLATELGVCVESEITEELLRGGPGLLLDVAPSFAAELAFPALALDILSPGRPKRDGLGGSKSRTSGPAEDSESGAMGAARRSDDVSSRKSCLWAPSGRKTCSGANREREERERAMEQASYCSNQGQSPTHGWVLGRLRT